MITDFTGRLLAVDGGKQPGSPGHNRKGTHEHVVHRDFMRCRMIAVGMEKQQDSTGDGKQR